MTGTIEITAPSSPIQGAFTLPYSKSIANRLLLMQYLSDGAMQVDFLSDAEDTQVLASCLKQSSNIYHCGEGGTTLRFLLAALALKPGKKQLHGSPRLSERPIQPLLDALSSCNLRYKFLEREGKLPLEITQPADTTKPLKVSVPGNISSQFVSALLMIAPLFSGGGEIQIKGVLTSKPYVEMTIALMKNTGVQVRSIGNKYVIDEGKYSGKFTTERDWSSASYAYSLCALSPESSIFLPGLSLSSIQGDSVCAEIAQNFGVQTYKKPHGIELRQTGAVVETFNYNFADCPDLAQTFAFLAIALGVNVHFTGLKTLRIKETDRITAIADVASRLGGQAFFGSDYLLLRRGHRLLKPGVLPVFNDHRMAMSTAPLSLKLTPLQILNAEVVQKSFPQFWEQLRQLGFQIQQRP